jgi:hypothetical protein
MDYPYEQLDPERFQTLCQALLAKEHKTFSAFPSRSLTAGVMLWDSLRIAQRIASF